MRNELDNRGSKTMTTQDVLQFHIFLAKEVNWQLVNNYGGAVYINAPLKTEELVDIMEFLAGESEQYVNIDKVIKLNINDSKYYNTRDEIDLDNIYIYYDKYIFHYSPTKIRGFAVAYNIETIYKIEDSILNKLKLLGKELEFINVLTLVETNSNYLIQLYSAKGGYR